MIRNKFWDLVLGYFFILAPFCVHAELLNSVPNIYAQNTKHVKVDLITITSPESSVKFRNINVTSNQYITCVNEQNDVAQYIKNNINNNLYSYNTSTQNNICILSRPGDGITKWNNNRQQKHVEINLIPKETKIAPNNDFNALLLSNSLGLTSPFGESVIPVQSNLHTQESLPSSSLKSSEPKEQMFNYVLGYYQPVALHSQVQNIYTLNFNNESRTLASELKQPYQRLTESEASNLQPLLSEIVINNNRPLNNTPILIYTNNQLVCFENSQLDQLKLGNDHNLWFEYFQPNTDPLVDNSMKCLKNGYRNTILNINNQTGITTITIPMNATSTQNINLGTNNEPIYPSGQIYANFTNYQLNGNQSNNSGVSNNDISGNFINTTATPIGSLINGLTAGNDLPLTRNYTYWQTDFPEKMTSLVIGDASPLTGSWGGSLPYAGIQYGSNIALRPGYFFTATPIINGTVNTPTTADILLNGAQTNKVDLAGGNFNLYNLPIVNGDGTVTVNIQNPNGNGYQSYVLPYYTSPKVLNNTTYLYQYNIGVPQTMTGTGMNLNSYQVSSLVGATQHYIGITNQYTMEIRAEAQTNQFANLGISHNMIWLNKFLTSFTTAVSQSESGMGTLFGFNLSRQSSLPNSIGFGYNAYLYSNNFAQLGMMGSSAQLQQTIFGNYNTPFGLTMALGYTNNSAYTENGNMSLYNLTLNWQFLRNFMINSSTSRTNQNGNKTFGTNLGLTVTFDNASSLNAQYNYQGGNNSQNINTYNMNYQYASPSNLWGYNVGGQYDDSDMATPTGINGSAYYLFKNFNSNISGSYANNNNYNSSLMISGNTVIGSNGVSFGQYSNLSFILVKVGDLPNVGIKQNGSIVGSTDRNGVFIIPNVSPYLPQDIQVNASDLPFNTELDSYSKRVVAPLNGGARVFFMPVSYVPAMAYLRYNNNKKPPVGYTATVYNDDGNTKIEDVYIIDNGQVQLTKYTPKMNYHLEFTVREGTFSCPITKENINPADSNEYITSLGTITCTKK